MRTITSRMSAMASFGMRGATLALCLAVVGTIPVMAQDASAPPQQQGDSGQPGGRPSPEQMVARQLQHLTKALSLTSDQVTQIKPILQNQMTQQ
jgi:Spy/CpxP family protein refolding chaperone